MYYYHHHHRRQQQNNSLWADEEVHAFPCVRVFALCADNVSSVYAKNIKSVPRLPPRCAIPVNIRPTILLSDTFGWITRTFLRVAHCQAKYAERYSVRIDANEIENDHSPSSDNPAQRATKFIRNHTAHEQNLFTTYLRALNYLFRGCVRCVLCLPTKPEI